MQHHLLDHLFVIDRLAAGRLKEAMRANPSDAPWLVDSLIQALAIDDRYGLAMVHGATALLNAGGGRRLAVFCQWAGDAGRQGPGCGLETAQCLSAILNFGDIALAERFRQIYSELNARGTYGFKSVFDALVRLLEQGDGAAASAYLELVQATFAHTLSYNQTHQFIRWLPQAVRGLAPARRTWQIQALHRLVQTDHRLAEPFLEGMEKGISLLSQPALNAFIDQGLHFEVKRAHPFFSLTSRAGRAAYDMLQTTVGLQQMRAALTRYLKARCPLIAGVRPLNELPLSDPMPAATCVCADGRWIYLPETIDWCPDRGQNQQIYKLLARLEAGIVELDTYGFDLEKAVDRYALEFPAAIAAPADDVTDLERFFRCFMQPDLARDLFIIFEHGRQHQCLSQRYPGMMHRAHAMLAQHMPPPADRSVLDHVYAAVVLQLPCGQNALVERVAELHANTIKPDSPVEACAAAVCSAYDGFAPSCPPLRPPFGRGVWPRLYQARHREREARLRRLHHALARQQIAVYLSDLRRQTQTRPTLTTEDIRRLTAARQGRPMTISQNRIAALRVQEPTQMPDPQSNDDHAFWYREWDCRLNDYLNDYVRVRHRHVPAGSDHFFQQAMMRHAGLVRHIRRAFGLLKPQDMTILRQWTEGDQFDYRALLDFALDRRAGIMPSDRLYIKRIKQIRDVAVLLLLDMSRSTGNWVQGRLDATVLDVAREAVVLFCQALDVVGDRFAVAGYSGTGRLGVDYYGLKDFDEPMQTSVCLRIGGISPQRNTRMGAAIRHATAMLNQIEARTRLLIMIGDGFPNDADYKRQYAVSDTCHAIREARARDIHVHAITVNLPGHPQLDALYGPARHSVISDVRQLPGKLLAIYRGLTA